MQKRQMLHFKITQRDGGGFSLHIRVWFVSNKLLYIGLQGKVCVFVLHIFSASQIKGIYKRYIVSANDSGSSYIQKMVKQNPFKRSVPD